MLIIADLDISDFIQNIEIIFPHGFHIFHGNCKKIFILFNFLDNSAHSGKIFSDLPVNMSHDQCQSDFINHTGNFFVIIKVCHSDYHTLFTDFQGHPDPFGFVGYTHDIQYTFITFLYTVRCRQFAECNVQIPFFIRYVKILSIQIR